MWVGPDVTQVIANYVQAPTPDLFILHIKQARGDFLTVGECLESLNLVEDTPDFASVFLQYLDQMFKGVPAMYQWPFFLRYRVRRVISPVRRLYRQDWDLQGRVQALQKRHACCENCRVQMHGLRAVLLDAQTLVGVLPRPDLHLAKRYQMARKYDMWAFIMLSLVLYTSCFA